MRNVRRRKQRGLCPICSKPIWAGDEQRWIALPTFAESRPVHARCFEEDWEFIEAGLEHFPRLLLTQA